MLRNHLLFGALPEVKAALPVSVLQSNLLLAFTVPLPGCNFVPGSFSSARPSALVFSVPGTMLEMECMPFSGCVVNGDIEEADQQATHEAWR